ncbi:5'-nucleotidase C-terminal domain-containing protein [Subsaxibacter sp. CAU 1640]|uniref:5'-nucleotidase C-terminal domain-containing protein n=1 Tax=Subsaxibacter sp. CAU 1640 TaxID=2933271 RepID=UPI002006BAE1|nr:5'-nucleotidase [Subsaxibacter sp. CAU 1640]MCK7590841.1 5'-nucleotidase C-terminal domain-containing protein [Subsaxibacter sp. CAU 1640]
MKNKPLLFCFALFILISCKTTNTYNKIEGKRITITDSLPTDQSVEAFIKPYREHVNKNLDSVISYAVNTYSKSDGHLNTAIGNFMADAMYEQSNPIFKKRTGKDIDFVLLNHGGIRAIISKGGITIRTAFEVMPFENAVVVTKLKGAQVKELLDYLIEAKRAHPISKLKIVLNKDGNLENATIKGQPIDYNKSYFVLTNDYLVNGGDRMDFFKKRDTLYVLDYKIRNALIDYFTKTDTINPVIDDRFIQLN